jgi:hypothetical protein
MTLADDVDIRVAMGVMQEQMKTLIEDAKEARHARKNLYISQEKRDEMLIRIEHRLEKVEAFILGASPTLAEFNALKLKAQGAGALGRVVWISAGALIGAIAGLSGWIGKLFDGLK